MRLVLFYEVSWQLRHCLTSLGDRSATHLVCVSVRELEAGKPTSDSCQQSLLSPNTNHPGFRTGPQTASWAHFGSLERLFAPPPSMPLAVLQEAPPSARWGN